MICWYLDLKKLTVFGSVRFQQRVRGTPIPHETQLPPPPPRGGGGGPASLLCIVLLTLLGVDSNYYSLTLVPPCIFENTNARGSFDIYHV